MIHLEVLIVKNTDTAVSSFYLYLCTTYINKQAGTFICYGELFMTTVSHEKPKMQLITVVNKDYLVMYVKVSHIYVKQVHSYVCYGVGDNERQCVKNPRHNCSVFSKNFIYLCM